MATAIEVRVAERRRPIFWRQIKSLKTQIVQMFLFDMFLPNYKSLFFMNAFPSEIQWHFDIRPTDTQICRCFKVHELITCESKVQVVVSLGSYEVLFALGHHEDLTSDT